ncbi:MAG: hypothetical protein KDE63_12275 [Novosphingobium sp.]|nr:hypothetical protein [Novosphingobium sp.]
MIPDLRHILHSCLFLGSAFLLASCDGGSPASTIGTEATDPAELAVLAAPLATDPDLTAENMASAAFRVQDHSPRYPVSGHSDAITSLAREEVARLVGQKGIVPAPVSRDVPGNTAYQPLLGMTAAARAAALGRDAGVCAATGTYSASWAAQMPDAFPIYPLGHVQEALGAESAGCALRSVRFTTVAKPAEARDFYHTLALRNGYSSQAAHIGNTEILKGSRKKAQYAVVIEQGDTAGGAIVDITYYRP